MLITSQPLVKATIGAGSLRALIIGSEVAKNPKILELLRTKWDITYPNLPTNYPFDRYLEMTTWLRQQLFPMDNEAKGYEKLGRCITKGFFQGTTGQILKTTIKIMGTQRSTPYFFRITGGALKFGRFDVVEDRPNFVRAILYNVPGSPDIMRGMALESIEATGAVNPVITVFKLSPVDTQYLVRWG